MLPNLVHDKKIEIFIHGYLDFEMFARSEVFLSGFEKIKKSMQKGFVIALMCSEKDPIKCHRTILVARAFHNAGYKVIHLLPEGQKITQEEIEERLLNMFFSGQRSNKHVCSNVINGRIY